MDAVVAVAVAVAAVAVVVVDVMGAVVMTTGRTKTLVTETTVNGTLGARDSKFRARNN